MGRVQGVYMENGDMLLTLVHGQKTRDNNQRVSDWC